jgi:DNA-3-methyladenine glycosylase II
MPADDSMFDDEGKPRRPVVRKALAYVSAQDPVFARWLPKLGPFRLELNELHNPYQALARAIVSQQISGAAAKAIFHRVELQIGGGRFPRPQVLLDASDESLRAAGLSRGKALSLRDLAAKTISRKVPTLRTLRDWEDQKIIDHLTAVRGIGEWTVQMMLMFRLGRSDVLPATDLGVRKGFGRLFLRGRLPAPAAILRRGERWRPYRSMVSWYLWRAAEL